MRPLTLDEIDAYDVVDREIAGRVRIVRVPILAPGVSGMTIGSFVFLRRDDDHRGGRELIAHELVHVRQYHEQGMIGFLWRYLRDYFAGLRRLRSHRRAYLAIPAEVQARLEAAAWAARR